jgi:FkbM family methyltransferase
VTIRQTIQNKYRTFLSRLNKSSAEMTGLRSRCMKGRDRIDELLEPQLPSSGTYIEAGALDGFYFSNTYYLDRVKGWDGILAEPNPPQFRECKRFRKRASVFNCALVPFDYSGDTVEIVYGADLTWTEGAYADEELSQRQGMLSKAGLSGERINVPARTVQSLIDESGSDITFFSLDVEGFECHVLRGLDFAKSAPEFLLIECQGPERLAEVKDVLGDRYGDPSKLTRHDYLFQRK